MPLNERLRSPFLRIVEEAPLVRVAVPYAVGIALGESGAAPQGAAFLWLVSAGLWLVLYAFLISIKSWRRSGAGAVVAEAALFLCLMQAGCGADLVSRSSERTVWPPDKRVWRAVVMETPRSTARTWAVTVRLDATGDGRKVLLSLLKDNIERPPRVGEAVEWEGRIERPHNFEKGRGAAGKGEDAVRRRPFDYARYLYRHSYTGVAFAKESPTVLPPVEADTIIQSLPLNRKTALKANCLRRRLADRYRLTGLNDANAAVLAALTIGERSEITADTRAAFSRTGASHVLALSGLHLGILVSILFLLLRPMGFSLAGRRVAIGLSVVMIWVFVVLTGAGVSTVRSALMLTLMLLLSLRGEGYSPLGNVVAAAVVILLCWPQALMDVGFRLSFLSVFFILYFLPYYQEWAERFGYRWKRRLMDFLFISVVTQAATMPVVAQVFGRLPLCFLLTNAVVIPCAYLLLAGAVWFFLVWWWPFMSDVAAGFLSLITRAMTVSVGWLSDWPFASLRVSVSPLACWTAYPLMFCLFALLLFRRGRYLVWSAAWGGVWLTALVWGAVRIVPKCVLARCLGAGTHLP